MNINNVNGSNLATLRELEDRAKAPDIEITARTCMNMSQFKVAMKQLRKVDDNIILMMNNTNTASDSECLAFFNALQTAYRRRGNDIEKCIRVMDKAIIKTERHISEMPDDKRAKSMLFSQQTQREWMENERSVENIVRLRSLDVFRARCQFFDLPQDFISFINKRI